MRVRWIQIEKGDSAKAQLEIHLLQKQQSKTRTLISFVIIHIYDAKWVGSKQSGLWQGQWREIVRQRKCTVRSETQHKITTQTSMIDVLSTKLLTEPNRKQWLAKCCDSRAIALPLPSPNARIPLTTTIDSLDWVSNLWLTTPRVSRWCFYFHKNT